MSSFNRRTFLISGLSLTALSACGFRPAFGPTGAATPLLNKVFIASPDDPHSFALVDRLEERIGRPSNPVYDLDYKITTRRSGLAITRDNITTRYNLDGKVTFTLRARDSGKELTSGTATTFTSYSAFGSTVASLTAERDAYERLMRLLADQIVARLIATSGDWDRAGAK